MGNKTRGAIRFFAMPAFRVAEQFAESAARLKRLQERNAAAREQARASAALSGAAGMTGAEKFEDLYQRMGWTAEELQTQLNTIKLTKLVAICSSLIGILLAIVTLWTLPGWAVIIGMIGCAGLTALGAARTFQFGLYQAQIEGRSILKPTEYIARPDFFRHLLGR